MHTLNRPSLRSFMVLVLALSRTVSATVYERKLSVVGSDFFKQFNWESRNDPTHGRVNYLTMEEAMERGLAYGLLFPPRPTLTS
jgi:hypothetical protein